MLSLDWTFAEVRRRLADPDALNPAKSDPLFYFVHEPEERWRSTKVARWTAILERKAGRSNDIPRPAHVAAHRSSGRWEEWGLETEPDYAGSTTGP